MFTFLIITTVIFFISLVVISSARPIRSDISIFELNRRSVEGDRNAKRILKREEILTLLVSLQRIVIALLISVVSIIPILAFGWGLGVLVAILLAITYGMIARVKFVHSSSQNLYESIEPQIIKLITKYESIFAYLQTAPAGIDSSTGSISSRQELQDMIERSEGVLDEDEKKIIVNGLSFKDLLVSSVMTPRSVIDTISKSEFLGPIMLDELHKLGHSRLPVINGDVDHVVGILHLQDLLTLDIKRSVTAEKAMEPKVFYIKDKQSLNHALAAFLRTHHHLFIVVNEYRETVGLLTLEDTIEALIGQKIVDEFDSHDDLRTVAGRNLGHNNNPKNHEDV
jgi:CBS domain containing-hemolysin-like protein